MTNLNTVAKLLSALAVALAAGMLIVGCQPRMGFGDTGITSGETGISSEETSQEETTSNTYAAKSKPTFTYEQIELPNEISQADSVCSCYNDSNAECLMLSVNSYNGKEFEVICRTDYIVSIDIDSCISTYEISTDADIISAVPYGDGIVYTDWDADSLYSDSEWNIVMTDGVTSELIASGTADYCRTTPQLFLIDGEVFYLWRTDESFGVSKISDSETKTLLEFDRDDCDISNGTTFGVYSNGSEYCFMVSYPDEENATFVICNAEGILYEYKLGGKITSTGLRFTSTSTVERGSSPQSRGRF